MVYKKLPALVLFLLAFTVITLSGYQCATQQYPSGRGSLPISTPELTESSQPVIDDYYPDDYFGGEDNSARFPEEVSDRCNRKQLRDLNYGSPANFEFDRASLQDFSFGQSQNFEAVCARLYLDMSRQGSVYKGRLAFALQTNSQVKTFQGFNSGYSASENRYNRWSGASWKENSNNEVNKKFYAIFEDEHSAIILKLENVVIRDVGDGEVDYRGAGKVYYKMFRIATKEDVQNTKGSCYSKGAYTAQAHTQPTARNNRCWFINFGPYNCRPDGSLDPKEKFKAINIAASNYKCFSRLGRFWNLNIEEAFNDSVEDIK